MFYGISNINNKAYFAHYNAKYVLVLESLDESMQTIELPKDCEKVERKWCRLTVYKRKLFASPCNSHCIFVIDTAIDTTFSISCGEKTGD